MWMTVVNLLIPLAIVLLLIFSWLGVRTYRQSVHSWDEIKIKASQSGVKTFDNE